MKKAYISYSIAFIFLLLLGLIVFSLSVNTQQSTEISQASEMNEILPTYIPTSEYFSDEDSSQIVVKKSQNNISKTDNEECVVHDSLVKEGTVASNSTCVNSISPLPTYAP